MGLYGLVPFFLLRVFILHETVVRLLHNSCSYVHLYLLIRYFLPCFNYSCDVLSQNNQK